MPFGFGGKKEPEVEKPEYRFEVKYLGGHKAFPVKKSVDTKISVYSDRIDIEKPLNLNIPYSKITKIENMDEKKISALRVVGLGLVFLPLAIVGALWKKRRVYTVFEYDDGLDTQTMVFDFEKHLEKMQPIIYHKVMQERSKYK